VIRLPDPCLVVLVGAAGAGKSHWARTWFDADAIVSSDRLRAAVGAGERDQRASRDAFELLGLIAGKRLARGLTTVIDSTGLDAKRRAGWLAMAEEAGVPAYAVLLRPEEKVVKERNRARGNPVPAKVVAAQLKEAAAIEPTGFAGVFEAGPLQLVPPELLNAPAAAARQRDEPLPLQFGLQVSRFDGIDVAEVARAAEAAGFASLWLMDHFLQIPQVGREWEDMLESYTTLGYLAAVTERIRLGTLVTGITHRTLPHLAKIVATLDVLSKGRANCGIGAGWSKREGELYGFGTPTIQERHALLQDALELLPLMWGPGAPPFTGRTIAVPETICYPRPVQPHVPILVGGGGEQVTLKLVARHADACNLFGDAATVRHKLTVLHGHCAKAGRDPKSIRVTHFAPALPGTPDEQVGRYRELAEAGVQTAIVGLNGADAVREFAAVVERFTIAR
jgi:F420-dependent oxidoreductase-like protein